ncbi:hypothetical protein FVR03_18335 [Pontibacter qinzhouensis]|uniref:Uncharacterized protein n=1 Tax=Pontibacter qinzhouensis TaxID=2603253 RepID=A0A5C8JA42_9BACT|nr:hypothetical protein [Pontibacter qinzhouensis]TXK33843.1 hypothetical protein FVR03_18335 [Pontibacter qinzhouensis]
MWLVLTLLFSLQMQPGHVFYEAKHRHADTNRELQLEQGIEVASAQGVLHEMNINFITAVILFLLLSVVLFTRKVEFFTGHFSLAANYWGCIVPQGP